MKADRILRWFPRSWRERYEVEIRALLEADTAGWRTHLDLATACADAWGRQCLVWGKKGTHGVWTLAVLGTVVYSFYALGLAISDGLEAMVPVEARAVGLLSVGPWLWIKTPVVFLLCLLNWVPGWWASGAFRKRVSTLVLFTVLLAIVVLETGPPEFAEGLMVGGTMCLPLQRRLRNILAPVLALGDPARKQSVA